jgi:proteic killer suppression protein
MSPELADRAREQLVQLDEAESLEELRLPPGNRLGALRGDRAGQDFIRINRQWRLCFLRRDGHAEEVEIVDYH